MDVHAGVAGLSHVLYPASGGPLYETCGNQTDAEDAAQEAFTKALRDQPPV